MPTAKGWEDGHAPTAAPGLNVNAFAKGLKHPRWIYVLPNGDVLTADSLTKHVTEAYPTALGAALSAAGFDITALDELAFTDAVAGATVVGRIRRNGANLEWHNGTASGRLFFAGGADVPVADGGTGLSSGTSGGVPYFSAAATIASSGALTANAIVLGGGAGAAPAALGSLGSTTTLLHGNASGAPTFSAVDLTADVSNQLPLANGGTAANLSDPGADRVLFWDESSNVITWLTLGTGFTITGTTDHHRCRKRHLGRRHRGLPGERHHLPEHERQEASREHLGPRHDSRRGECAI